MTKFVASKICPKEGAIFQLDYHKTPTLITILSGGIAISTNANSILYITQTSLAKRGVPIVLANSCKLSCQREKFTKSNQIGHKSFIASIELKVGCHGRTQTRALLEED